MRKGRERKEKLRKPEICFSGFNFEEREELETQSVIKGLNVRKSVTKDLAYLVIGETPGEKKLKKQRINSLKSLDLVNMKSVKLLLRNLRKRKERNQLKQKLRHYNQKPRLLRLKERDRR